MKNNFTITFLLLAFQISMPCALMAQSDAFNTHLTASQLEFEQKFAAEPTAENAKLLSHVYLELAATVFTAKKNDSVSYFLEKSKATWLHVQPQNATHKANAYLDIGCFYLDIKNYVLADSILSIANKWAMQTNDDNLKVTIQMELVYINVARGDMARAAIWVESWQNRLENLTDLDTKSTAYQRIGTFYNAYNTSEKARLALPFFKRGLEIAEELFGKKDARKLLFNLGALRNTYNILGQKDSAILIGKRLETLLPKLNVTAQIWVLMINAGDYLHVENTAKAQEYLEKTWKLIENNGLVESDDGQFTLYLFGKLAIAEGRFSDAENYLKRALIICKKIDYKIGQKDVLTQLVGVSEKQNKYQEQARYQKELSHLEVSLAKDSFGESMADMEVKLNVVEKDRQIGEQKSEQKLLWIGLLLMGLVAGLSLWFYLRLRKQRQELAMKNTLLGEQNQLIDRQNKELTHLDQAKTRFFANVSHELRTPLTLILGPINSMLKRNRLENTDFTHAKTAQIHAQDLLKLVNEILDLSKMESGKMRVQETTVSFQPFVRRLVSAFESHAERLGIHFQFEYQAEKRLRLAVDTDKLTRILNNLLSNAMKFTPKNGSITVKIEDLANTMRLSVSDTGRGIHPNDLPNVFERFYQTNQTDAPIEGGTGIGLALCREFAEVLGGRIWVESELGKGSQFYFEFPKKEVLGVGNEEMYDVRSTMYDDDTPEVKPNIVHLTSDIVHLTSDIVHLTSDIVHLTSDIVHSILVVEDNSDLRNYIAAILRGANYQILEAENGLEALDLLQVLEEKQQLPQLILSDIMMPVMDGFQLLKVLKDRPYFQQIPVVMLTARADIRDKLTALRIGVDDYLLKPFEEDELLVRIDNLLKNSQLRQQFKIEAAEILVENSENTEEGVTTGSGNFESFPNLKRNHEEQAWLADLEKKVLALVGDFNLNVDRLADDLHTSRNVFYKKVKLLTGMTPNDYLSEIRYNQARSLLENRRVQTVKETAFAVGVRDVKYFSEQFRKRFGKSPSDYLS